MSERKRCKKCSQEVVRGRTHYCPKDGGRAINYDDDGFLMSLVIGAATDSALFGMALGGDPAGAIIGDIMSDGDLDVL